MEGVLKKLNMQSLYPNFEGKKNTPDIVCLVSSSELNRNHANKRHDEITNRVFSSLAFHSVCDLTRGWNVRVTYYMIKSRGPTGMITGKSTHNQRIERLWGGVYEGVLSFFYNFFGFIEDENILDLLKEVHITAFHFVYLDEIDRHLSFWAEPWAGHKVRTVRSSPLRLWTLSQIQNPIGINEENIADYGVESFIEETFIRKMNDQYSNQYPRL
ncbi:unnamed protein product [Mytilus coruscus]|uniref:Integrase core domain-containing protein n=1 Tax=Mytilus coruscus TaxID=42192 RepID=A0A6J8B5W6_MYTCO|nr:unnamed protein product [Mytilus coruscus]